jgi:hypothetical protein
MGTPKYDDFELAVLKDAIFTADSASSLDGVHIASILREVHHVLEMLQEPEAAMACLNLATAGMSFANYESDYDKLMEKLYDVFDAFDVDEDDVEKLAVKAMLIPEGFTEDEILGLVNDEQVRQQDAKEKEDEDG